jgi:hypothetical protein
MTLKKTNYPIVRRWMYVGLFLLSFIPITSFSQQITEKLGGVSTNFKILSDSAELNIIDQGIFQRGYKNTEKYSNVDYGYSYGYGMQTYRLEFITKGVIAKPTKDQKKCRYAIIFLDVSGRSVLETTIGLNEITAFSTDDNLSVYSVNLYEIPLIILEKTRTINIALTCKYDSFWGR